MMNVTDEEDDLLQWCFLVLDEEQIESCRNDAKVSAAAEIRADDAAVLLTCLFSRVIVRSLRWIRAERERERSTTTPEGIIGEGSLQPDA